MKFYILSFSLLLSLIIGCAPEAAKTSSIDGIQIPLPEDWIDKSQSPIKDSLANFQLTESAIKEHFKTNKNGIPVAIFLKYEPTETSGPIPTIQVNIMPNTAEGPLDLKSELQSSITTMETHFNTFEILTPLEEIIVDEIKGMRYVGQLDMPNDIGEVWTVKVWTYAFPSGEFFYQINFSDIKGEDNEELYNQLISQLKFRK